MKTKFLFVIIGILIIIHLLMVFPTLQHPTRFLTRDSYDYLDLARTFLSTGRYSGTEYPGIDLKRPPVYPLFLMIGLWLGHGETSIISLLQVLLSFFTAFLLYRIFAKRGYHKAGLVAVIVYLLNPNAAFWSTVLMTETLAGFWIILGLWCLVQYRHTQHRRWPFGAGLAFSMGALTRPIIFPLAIGLGMFFFLFEWWRTRQPIQPLKLTAIFIVGVFVLVLPWQLRNLVVNRQFTLSEVGESTFRDWMVAQTLASAEGISRDEASAMIASSPAPMQYSLEVIRSYPLIFAKEQGRGILRTLLGAEYGSWAKAFGGEETLTTGVLSAFLDQGSLREVLHSLASQAKNPWFWSGVYAFIFDLVLYSACLFGVLSELKRSRHRHDFSLMILLMFTLFYLLIIPGAAGESRFRVPADPLLSLTTGLAFKPK